MAEQKRKTVKTALILTGSAVLALMLFFIPSDGLTIGGFVVMVDLQDHTCLDNHHIFLVDLHDRQIIPGQLYAFRGVKSGFFPDDQVMIKKLVARGGDEVEVNAKLTLVNEQVVARGLEAASAAGLDPELFKRRFTLAEDEFFMVGTSKLSLDSRYWGPVRRGQILGRAYIVY